MNNFLYIDPGTGSMLFTVIIGAATTLFFLLKEVIIKSKIYFSGGKATEADKSYKKFVIYGEDSRYWNVFKPILEEFEKRNIEVTYFVANDKDPAFNENYKFVKTEVIGTGNKAYAKLNMLSAGFVLMTTPSLQVYQLKRSKNVAHYSHIFHSCSDSMGYRLFSLDYFDSVLMSGDFQGKYIRILEEQRELPKKELITVGCPYLDTLKSKFDAIPAEENHQFTVLLSPSWGKSGILSLYGEELIDPLVETGWKIIIRPHPQSKISEKEMLERLHAKYDNIPNVEWDDNRENIYSLKRADIMISDFSGIVYDYLFLCDKPVLYATSDFDLEPYDGADIPEDVDIWQFSTLKKVGVKLEKSDFAGIKSIIENMSDNEELKEARHKAKDEAWMHIGQAGKLTVDYMLSKVKND